MKEKDNIFTRIEEIRINEQLGVTEFLDATSLSKGTYYKLKEDNDSKITNKIIIKINKAFPKYTINWIKGISKDLPGIKEITPFFKENGSVLSMEELSTYISKNIHKLKGYPSIKNAIDVEALKVILKAKKGDSIDIDLIG